MENSRLEESELESHARLRRVALAFGATGIALSAGFFPLLYNRTTVYDDEGFWLVTIRQFLHHGSLYDHTLGNSYGPFYFSFTGLLYRITAQTPTLFNGRLFVLIFTVLASGILGATVWRVTRSLPASILCQVATFSTLILVAGNEPMSPGSIIALALSVLVYAVASYSVQQRSHLLVIAGASAGALTLIKINIGIFAVAGLVFAFVVGNTAFSRWFRVFVATCGVALAFAVMLQQLSKSDVATFAVLVAMAMLGTSAVLSTDTTAMPPRGLLLATEGFAGVVVVSLIWPLASGTTLSSVVMYVLVRPLQQVNIYTVLPVVEVQWIPIALTAIAVVAVVTLRDSLDRILSHDSQIRRLALAFAAFIVMGLGVGTASATTDSYGRWIPAIALLPALALLANAPPHLRVALRFVVPITILQVLHAYPVAGSQEGWGTFLVFVPCTIALAGGVDGVQAWREARPHVRAFAAGSLCLIVALGAGLWPIAAWVEYSHLVPLRLPGAQLVRVDKSRAKDLRTLTRIVKRNCDTFYSVPGIDSLYIFSGLPTPTGLLANWAGAMTTGQEREVVKDLTRLQDTGKRVCIVRDLNSPFYAWGPRGSEANRPIGRFIRHYQRTIATFGPFITSEQVPRYSVSLRGASSATTPTIIAHH